MVVIKLIIKWDGKLKLGKITQKRYILPPRSTDKATLQSENCGTLAYHSFRSLLQLRLRYMEKLSWDVLHRTSNLVTLTWDGAGAGLSFLL